TPYREMGWTIRQVVHHCADSHMNSLTRFKLTLTEDKPVVKPYWEDRWAELVDSKSMPISPSVQMLEGIHARWTVLLNSLSEQDLVKSFIHPEHGKEFRVDENIGVYAWHCNHHLAHITELKKRKNWK
ncbi:MAG: YfiT family bacillithiol transferase, partial [Flavobacteriales bacterium]